MADTIVKSDWQKFHHVGYFPGQLQNVSTKAAAATLAVDTFHTIVTGTTQVATITPPYTGFAGMIALTFTDGSPGATLTTGNIQLATTVVRYKTLYLFYDPQTTKWYPSY